VRADGPRDGFFSVESSRATAGARTNATPDRRACVQSPPPRSFACPRSPRARVIDSRGEHEPTSATSAGDSLVGGARLGGGARAALATLEQLLKADRYFPGLDGWLARASAHVARAEEAEAENRRAAGAGLGAPPVAAAAAGAAAGAGGAAARGGGALLSTSEVHLKVLAARTNFYAILELCHDFEEARVSRLHARGRRGKRSRRHHMTSLHFSSRVGRAHP